MQVQKRNDVSIYCLSAGAAIPEWMGDRAKRNLAKRSEGVRRRVELLQDFQMPASSSKLVQSRDGRYIMAAGIYPPRIRCYDVHDVSMKFERYLDSTVVDMALLGEDYGKIALLLDDRTLAFHAQYGNHTSVRIPTFGRAMAYEPSTCELIVAARGNQVYRLNLDEGRFSEPWNFSSVEASGCCIAVNQSYPLTGIGCDDGVVRFWDARSPDVLKPFLHLNVGTATTGYGYADENLLSSSRSPKEISALAFDSQGLYVAAGTCGGNVALYDVRSSRPLYIQEHRHGLPIHTVDFHSGSNMVLSSDEKLIKVWRYRGSIDGIGSSKATSNFDSNEDANQVGSLMVNIEGNGKFQNFIVAGDETDPSGQRSGVILCATDQPKMDSFYVPALGVAPRWCSYLENITEELEERDLNREGGADKLVQEGQEAIYENYKFVSRDDLEKLGISNLVGTPMLRGYMHGFFMDINLYNRVRAVANPFEYEEYQKKKLKDRMEAKRASRIAPRKKESKKKVAVNPDLAERLESKKGANVILSDDRFGGLFTNPDFVVDEEDENFKLRNPSGVAAARKKKDNLDSDDESEGDIGVEDEPGFDHSENDDGGAFSESFDSDSDEDGFAPVRGEAYEEMKALEKVAKGSLTKKAGKKGSRKVQKVVASESLEGADGVDVGLGNDAVNHKSKVQELHAPISERLASLHEASNPAVRVKGGNKEASYVPASDKRKQELSENDKQRGKRGRRGIKELGLKTPFKHHARSKR